MWTLMMMMMMMSSVTVNSVVCEMSLLLRLNLFRINKDSSWKCFLLYYYSTYITYIIFHRKRPELFFLWTGSCDIKWSLTSNCLSGSDMATWCQRPSWGRSSAPSALWAACWSSLCRFLSLCPTSAESTTRAREPRRDEHRRWRAQTQTSCHVTADSCSRFSL